MCSIYRGIPHLSLLLLLRRRRVVSTAFRLVFFFSPALSVLPPSRSLPPSLSLVVEKQRGASLPEKRVTVATGGSARRVSSLRSFLPSGLTGRHRRSLLSLSPFFLRLLLVSPSVRPRLTERHTSVSTRARNPRRGPFDVVSPPPTAEFARRSVADESHSCSSRREQRDEIAAVAARRKKGRKAGGVEEKFGRNSRRMRRLVAAFLCCCCLARKGEEKRGEMHLASRRSSPRSVVGG